VGTAGAGKHAGSRPGAGPTAYDVADRYDDAYFQDLADRYLRRSRFARRRVANVLSLLPPLRGARVLDLGCGMGTFTLEAARLGAQALGIDLAPAALPAAAHVAERVAEGGDGTSGKARFVRADAARLPITGNSLDLVLAADFTEHLDETTLRTVLKEAVRVLRPQGRLVLYTPSPTHLLERLRAKGILHDQDPSHIGMRTREQLVDAVRQAGFDVVHTTFLPSHLPGLELAERAFARWIPLLRRRIGIVATRPAAVERTA
jgi:SAM-dependent methyltransferase